MSGVVGVDPGPVIAELRVYGTPAPQGNKTPVVSGGRLVVLEGRRKSGRDRHKAWREAVAAAAEEWYLTWCQDRDQCVIEGPVMVEMTFFMPRGKSVRRRLPSVRPDCDKIVRATLDALSGWCFDDDARVVWINACKVYATPDQPPGADIVVRAASATEEEE